MALPREFHSDIQHRCDVGYFIYFKKNVSSTLGGGCGYFAPTRQSLIKECSLKSLNKFDSGQPTRWSEIRPLRLRVS